jgi:hypothetical protein
MEQKVTAEAARAVYGVIIEDGAINAAATTAERDQHRARRRGRSQVPGERRGQASLAAGRRLDDNLVQAPAPGGSGTIVACRHCAEILGGPDPDGADPSDTLALARYEGPSAEAGPQIIADPADYVDAPIVFRQYCCPRAGPRCTRPSSRRATSTRSPASAGSPRHRPADAGGGLDAFSSRTFHLADASQAERFAQLGLDLRYGRVWLVGCRRRVVGYQGAIKQRAETIDRGGCPPARSEHSSRGASSGITHGVVAFRLLRWQLTGSMAHRVG